MKFRKYSFKSSCYIHHVHVPLIQTQFARGLFYRIQTTFFSAWVYVSSRKCTGHISKGKKRGSKSYSKKVKKNQVSKIFSTNLGSIRVKRFQFRQTLEICRLYNEIQQAELTNQNLHVLTERYNISFYCLNYLSSLSLKFLCHLLCFVVHYQPGWFYKCVINHLT